MHKQHEDQPSNNLPNLSTWHRVPEGSIIPKGTPYAYAYEGGITVELGGHYEDVIEPDNSYFTYYTKHPIVASPLPTEEGATILASSAWRPPRFLLTRKGGRWVNRYGAVWRVDQLTAWTPVSIGETVAVRP